MSAGVSRHRPWQATYFHRKGSTPETRHRAERNCGEIKPDVLWLSPPRSLLRINRGHPICFRKRRCWGIAREACLPCFAI